MIRTKPTVSIITGTFNSAAYLENFVASMSAQTFPNFECLFVDDGSRDDTVAKLIAICDRDPRFKLMEKRPEGSPAISRNVGIQAARGDFIAFCDHDDFWAPQKLEFQLRVFSQFPNASFVHTGRIIKKDLIPLLEFPNFDYREDLIKIQNPRKGLYLGCNVTHSSVMVSADLLQKVSSLNPNLRGVDDYHLFLKLSLHGPIILIDLPLTYYYWHEKNLSHVHRIFIDGLYQMSAEMKKEGLPEWLRAYVTAQALKSDAVSNLIIAPWQATKLLVESIRFKIIPRSLYLLLLSLILGILPSPWRKKIATKLGRFRQSPLLRSNRGE